MASQRDLLTVFPEKNDLETLDKKKYGEVIKVLKFIFQVDDEGYIPKIDEVITS